MNINDLTKLVDDKIDQNPYKIVIEYYKVIMRVSKKELDEAVELIAIRLENLNYTVYEMGEHYCYDGEEYEVQSNELLVAISNEVL